MTPHLQTETGENVGNCFATCIACVLDIPVESVPNFKEIQEANNSCMVDLADAWLREHYGKRLISIELYREGQGPLTTQTILNRLCHRNFGEFVILSGESPRRQADGRPKYHCVVGRATMWGYDVVHDPHPEGGGIVGQPYGVKWLVPVS